MYLINTISLVPLAYWFLHASLWLVVAYQILYQFAISLV